MLNRNIISRRLIRFEKFVDDLCLEFIGCEEFPVHSFDDCAEWSSEILKHLKKSKSPDVKAALALKLSDFEVKRLITHSLGKHFVFRDFYYNNLSL